MYKCNFTETLLRQMVEQPVTNIYKQQKITGSIKEN